MDLRSRDYVLSCCAINQSAFTAQVISSTIFVPTTESPKRKQAGCLLLGILHQFCIHITEINWNAIE